MAERFSSILVANRGEIALRVIRTAKELGYRTAAIASEADRDAPHAKAADEAVVIGPAPVGSSYLDMDRVISAAKESGAEAIHPGYGFLSENAAFAQRCADEGLVFIGPSPRAIELMGDKAGAKRAMLEAGVPCIPGYQGTDQSDEVFIAEAEKAGYPVMVKAAAGGGGRGMRLVRSASDLPAALADARSEAENAFGSGVLILEKAIEDGRHVEVQVFGDAHGSIIHLGERDCSLQRRHQKVIEEAPSPAVDADLRERMGRAACEAAAAVDYQGAGTVEFLLGEDGSFYFLEMNTRLQVEHPVTEEVTGLDLVALQLKVAQGKPLGLTQDDVKLCGHSIEARLYAEEPGAGFLPSTGPVKLWRAPAGVRTDAGIETGGEVTPHYDPMVAKVIATGASRDEAIRKLTKALEDTALIGPQTNRQFLRSLLKGEAFRTGDARTTTIDRSEAWKPEPARLQHLALAAAIIHARRRDENAAAASLPEELRGWASSEALYSSVVFAGEDDVAVRIAEAKGELVATLHDRSISVRFVSLGEDQGLALVDGTRIPFSFTVEGATIALATADQDLTLTDLTQVASGSGEAGGIGAVTAVMHGLVTEVFVTEGDRVEKGQRLAILEAMKMQHEVTAPVSGAISALPAAAGKQVAGGDLLLQIEPDTEE
ncbi:biotin/lipoyl-binding protein [Parvularcula sp. ZS-1/3]|uniref:Biotin/lipoyl-binding protein n=1 Tax=Parvularcula mediterranea TaxID=2732508 RepID=A0A7Y3W4W1_9PROT|nr:biotin carboxylase N-terminal domain-containing protein [Parvularcula mediterranea]NNU16175.1 biotin/lipoyl-binding protein [Parvularcula mediterranea]